MKLNWKTINYELAGCRGEIELSPLTAIVGPAGVGKSTVLRAIRLAVLQDSNVLGRTPQEFLSMDREAISVELKGTVGKHTCWASWRAENLGGKMGAPTGCVEPEKFRPEQWLPAREGPLRKLNGTALRRLIADRFAPTDIALEDGEFNDLFDEIAEKIDQHPGTTRAATAVMAHCDKEIRSLGHKKGAAGKVAKAQKQVLDPKAIEDQIKAKKKELKAAKKALEELPKLCAVREKIERLSKKTVEIGNKIMKTKERIAEVASSTKECPTCKQTVVKEPGRLAKLDETLDALCTKSQKTNESLRIVRTRETTILKTESVRVDCLNDEVRALEVQLETAKTARTVAKVTVLDYEREQRRLKALRDELNAAMEGVIETAVTAARQGVANLVTAIAARQAVEVHMFSGFTPVLKMAPLAWGVESRGAGRYASASGSQGAVLEIALRLAFAKPTRPPLVLLDDEDFTHLSKSQVFDYLTRLKEAQGGPISQVIVARPQDRIADIPGSYEILEIEP